MARGEVVNSIHDLQFEWASSHAHKSIRDFPLSVKGFTPRRYRYIMKQAPALQWNTRRQEIQNNVLSAKQESLFQDALETNNQIFKAAKLAAALTMRDLVEKGEKGTLTSRELVEYMKSLETTQTVPMRALGIAPEIERRIPPPVEPCSSPHFGGPSTFKGPDPSEKLSYDDVMTLIEIRRDQKQQMLVNRAD